MKFAIERERLFIEGLAPEEYIEGLACFLINAKKVTPEEFSKKILLFCSGDSFEYKRR